ncbi:MAG TPA: hypothetical protein VN817_05625 [Solirubrobacteraceae bacterium]|nr:hypothetical protein [Solirubrobacteraceae bacterium]
MLPTRHIDYAQLAVKHAPERETWDTFVRNVLVDRWLADYARVSDWSTQVLEIPQGELTFLFDAGPTLTENRLGKGEDRVVAAWGCSQRPASKRDRGRLAGFLPFPRLWSGAKRDRGHFIAHAAGGGTDLNLFPQAIALNRGRSEEGKRWRDMERYTERNPDTPLFVRPIYDTGRWTPAALDFAVLTATGLRAEHFSNRA